MKDIWTSDGGDVITRMIDRYMDPVLPNLLPDDRGVARSGAGGAQR